MSPEQHADDLHRVIQTLGSGPVDAFGSSGGAVNLLALCAAHPEDVRRAVAHEPPVLVGLPDEVTLIAAIHDMGRPVADFPGDHGSFFDSSYGGATGVEEAAERLRELMRH